MGMERGFWLIGNRHGGIHVARGRSAAEAKSEVLAQIAEAFAGQGLSPSACRRAACSYQVRLVAGPLEHDGAWAARDAREREDWETALLHALLHARPQIRRQIRRQYKLRGDDFLDSLR